MPPAKTETAPAGKRSGPTSWPLWGPAFLLARPTGQRGSGRVRAFVFIFSNRRQLPFKQSSHKAGMMGKYSTEGSDGI